MRFEPNSSSPLGLLTEQERIVGSKKGMGIWTRDMKSEAKLPDNAANKCLKSLQAKELIKVVVTIQNKRRHHMATKFKPSPEITGGS